MIVNTDYCTERGNDFRDYGGMKAKLQTRVVFPLVMFAFECFWFFPCYYGYQLTPLTAVKWACLQRHPFLLLNFYL